MSNKAQDKLDRKLYDAVKKNKLEQVHKYLREGADPDAEVGKGGTSAMNRAAKLKDRAIEIALLNQGGTLDPSSSLAGAHHDRDRAGSFSSHGSNGSTDGRHWIANSHDATPTSNEVTLDAEASAVPSLVANTPLDGPNEALTKGLRKVGNARSFTGRWLYVKKVVERVATVAVNQISLDITPYAFGNWKIDVKNGQTLLGERMITIEKDLLDPNATSFVIGPATLNVDALSWLLEKECRVLEADKRKAELDFTSNPIP